MKRADDENRTKQIFGGICVLIVLAVIVCGAITGWRFLPGLLGEWIGTMVGVMTTPFFLEGSFLVIGLTVVVALNIWRRHKEGEELVYLEQVEGPDVPEGLPDHAKWAVYREIPLEGEVPSLQAQAEGALAIGDFDSASEAIAAMSEDDLKRPEILTLRLELARKCGKVRLAEELERELRSVTGSHG